jgi:hypothetical protein
MKKIINNLLMDDTNDVYWIDNKNWIIYL